MAVATGIYWNKLTPGGGNVNSTTSSALTDMGGGATFFDNMVEVRATCEQPVNEWSRSRCENVVDSFTMPHRMDHPHDFSDPDHRRKR